MSDRVEVLNLLINLAIVLLGAYVVAGIKGLGWVMIIGGGLGVLGGLARLSR